MISLDIGAAGMHILLCMPPAPARHGRPPRARKATVNTTLRLSKDVHDRLVKMADERLVSRGKIVNRALEAYLPQLENDAV